jgi:hypothetical protein
MVEEAVVVVTAEEDSAEAGVEDVAEVRFQYHPLVPSADGTNEGGRW